MDKNRNRIPAAEISEFDSWSLDDIDNGNVIEVIHTEGRQANPNISNKKDASEPITAEQLESITQQAYEEGHKEGYEHGQGQGYEAGLNQGQTEINNRLQQLQQLIGQLHQHISEQDENIEATLLQIITKISSAVIQRELSDNNHATLQSVISRAVKALPVGADNICIYLSPQDFAALNEIEGRREEWQFREDANLALGDCRVETANSLVEYPLQAQFEEIIAQLYGQADSE